MSGRVSGKRASRRLGRAIWCTACACLASVPSRAEEVGPTRSSPVAEVVVRHAARECFTSLVHASGYLVPRASAVVMFPAAGYKLTEVRAKVGDTVKRGDIVARAAPASAPAGKPGAPSEVALTSPASGTVLQSTAFVGTPTSEKAKPLFTIAIDGVIEASVAVPSVHILELEAGQPARLTLRDGSVLDAHVRRSPAVVDPASQTGTARLSIDAREGLEPSRFEIGGFVLATIEARRSCGLGVPVTALRRTSAGTSVQVVENDVVVRRRVALGLASETDSEITSGLAEGDAVLAGTGVSRDGDRVKPVFADPQDER